MSFRLALDAPLPQELRRCLEEQLGNAVGRLQDPERDRATAVHDARKSVKKARALLRLVSSDLPSSIYQQENSALRDAGRLLSGTRDADVLSATLDSLEQRYAGRVPETVFASARSMLPASDAVAQTDPAATAAAALNTIRGRIATWPLERCDGDTLVRGTTKAYTRGRAALREVERDPSVEALHEWRKRVKDMWYHQRLLRELWPPVLKAQAAETERLSELLGDDHDLAVLAEHLGNGPADARVAELLPLIAERRTGLQRETLVLGQLIYTERPKAMKRRMRRWIDAGRPAASGSS